MASPPGASAPGHRLKAHEMVPAETFHDLIARFTMHLPAEDIEDPVRLMFSVEEAWWFYEDFLRNVDGSLSKLELVDFARGLFQHSPRFEMHRGREEELRREFGAYKRVVPVCGAILLNPAMDKCLLVRGLKTNDHWMFPRGKRANNETDAECASREVLEETGIDLAIVEGETPYIEKHNGEQRMRLFIVPGIDESTAFAPKCRGEIGAYAWHLIDELPRTHGEATNVYLDSEGKRHRFYMVWQFIGDLVKWLRVPPKGKRAAEDAGGADGKREARARRAQDGVGPSTPVKPVDVVRVEAKKAKKGGDKGAEAATSQPQAEGKKAKKGANGAKAVAATEAAVPAVAQPEGKKAKKNGGKVATETVVPKAAAVQPAEAPKVAPPKAKAKQEVTPVGRAEGRMQPSTNVAPAPAASQKAAEVKGAGGAPSLLRKAQEALAALASFSGVFDSFQFDVRRVKAACSSAAA